MRAAESSSENKRAALKYIKVREPTMTKLEKVLYTAKAHATGGRDGLTVRLNASLPGIEREVARELVDAAEQLRGLR
jgi:hypothetical protein